MTDEEIRDHIFNAVANRNFLTMDITFDEE